MSIRELSRPAGAALADLVEQSAVLELAIQQEAPRSDAPSTPHKPWTSFCSCSRRRNPRSRRSRRRSESPALLLAQDVADGLRPPMMEVRPCCTPAAPR